MALLLRAAGIDDLDAGAGPDTGRAGGYHFPEIFQGADATRGFDAHDRADCASHEFNIGDGGTGGGEAGGGLDEIGVGGLGEAAREDLLLVVEEGGFENDFDDGTGGVAGLDDGGDIVLDFIELAGAHGADIQDHIDFASSGADGGGGFGDLTFGGGSAEGERDDGADCDGGAGEFLGSERDPIRVDADAGEDVVACFGAETDDIGADGFGFQDSVVDKTSYLVNRQGKTPIIVQFRRD